MKEKTIKVTYTFKVKYEHGEHLAGIKRDLRAAPVNEMFGGGAASDGEVYSYSCKRVGKGSITSQ